MTTGCMRRSLRNPEAFFTALTLPIVLMLLFVYVFGGDLATGGKYVNYVVPGLIVLCAGLRRWNHCGRRGDRHDKRHHRPDSFDASARLVAPCRTHRGQSRSEPGGHRLGDRSGSRPRLASDRCRRSDWIAAAAMIVLFVLALSWLAAGVGLLARSAEAATSFTMVLMFIPYVSTAFVPAHTMPAVLNDIARYQPFTPIIESMRGLWMGRTSTGVAVGHEVWIAIAYCAGILILSTAAASWLFRHRTTH